MIELPKSLIKVVSYFKKLPGVGEKTALRQALILSSWSPDDIIAFGQNIKSLLDIKKCVKCGLFADIKLCYICSSEKRIATPLLCIVENISDCIAIEKSGDFEGRFHILGGVLNPLLGIGPDELSMKNLKDRVNEEKIEEVILAINPTVEGDATCSYIKQILPADIVVERIGFGMPMGGSLEYLDSITITKAIENRKRM